MTQILTSALHSSAHTQGRNDCWGIFLPNNSRHSAGLSLSLQLLSSDPLTLCFHEFWNKGPAPVASKHWLHLPSVDHRQQRQWVPTPNLCPSVEPPLGFPHVLYSPSTCQLYFYIPETSLLPDMAKIIQKLILVDIKAVWPADAQIMWLH